MQAFTTNTTKEIINNSSSLRKEVMNLCGIKRAFLSEIESGRSKVPLRHFENLAELFMNMNPPRFLSPTECSYPKEAEKILLRLIKEKSREYPPKKQLKPDSKNNQGFVSLDYICSPVNFENKSCHIFQRILL